MSAVAPPGPAASPPPVVRRRSDQGPLYGVIAALSIALVLVVVGSATSWYGLKSSSTSSSPTGCPTGSTLYGYGASFLNAVMSSWKQGFNTATTNKVVYTANGAGAGITDLATGVADFSATDEPLNASEVASMPGTTLTLPVTGGPVVIVFNIPSVTQLNLTPWQLADIYLGTITNWNSTQLSFDNPHLPSGTIVTVHRSDQAGTTYVLTNLLSIYNATWNRTVGTTILPTPWPKAPTQIGAKGNSALATAVKSTSYSIGYVDLPDAITNSLSQAAVFNKAGFFVMGTLATTNAAIANLSGQPIPPASGNWSAVSWVNAPGASSFPLATLSYFIVLQNPKLGHTASLADAQVLVQWLRYVLTTGQGLSAADDFVNPPANLVTQDLTALGSMVYGSSPIPACT